MKVESKLYKINNKNIIKKEKISSYLKEIELQNNITIIKLLGEGGNGIVYLININGVEAALKIEIYDENYLKVKETIVKKLTSESIFVKNLHHKNIVRTLKTFISEKNNSSNDCILSGLLMEKASIGSLNQFLSYFNGNYLWKAANFKPEFPWLFQLSEYTIKNVIFQTLNSLLYLNQSNFCHFDIKPENVLLSINSNSLIVKLADFDTAKETWLNSFLPYKKFIELNITSGSYNPPETFAIKTKNNKRKCMDCSYSDRFDIFSVGAMIFKMITRKLLICYQKDKEMYFEDISSQVEKGIDSLTKENYDISKDLLELMKNLLNQNYYKRYGIYQALNDKFFSINHTQQIIRFMNDLFFDANKYFLENQKLIKYFHQTENKKIKTFPNIKKGNTKNKKCFIVNTKIFVE